MGLKKGENGLKARIIKQENTFMLENGYISYCFGIEKDKYLSHRYFGKYLKEYTGISESYFFDRGFCANPDPEDKKFSLDTLPQEYPDMNQGDFRMPAYVIQTEDGRRVTRFYYKDYEIIQGKPPLEGLPSVYTENEDEAATLCITLEDEYLKAQIKLYYTIFRDYDVICRHTEVIHYGSQPLYLERLMSMSIDFQGTEYDLLTLSGSHLNEKKIYQRPIGSDTVILDSCRGASSPQETPCMILSEREAGEYWGQVWGMNYVYSGDFQAVIQPGQYGSTRVQIGMNPMTFGWTLETGQRFVSPETVMVYSDKGRNGMSQIFHELYRKRLCRGFWRDKERPVLLNSWEAFEFQIDEEKCLSMAQKAAELGIELFVLDDGWFKNRTCDRKALGDWEEDRNKFAEGLKRFSEKIRDKGIQFGIWFEPEMVSGDSDLYRRHPDWIIRSPYYEPIVSRSQYVLDLSNPKVCQYIMDAVSHILRETKAVYVKWDMNRHITDLGSFYLDQKHQRELSHRYMLGLYSILDRLNQEFPEVLFEGCSSGGGRFDAGMLYYMPQTWTSDNTDAVCRMKIQYGTSLLFPPVTMGSHVSAVPNHQTGRETPLETRFAAAMSGNLGYEMDIRELTQEETKEIRNQVRFYKKIRKTIQSGKMYRLRNPQEQNEAAWNFVSEDGETVVYCYFRILSDPQRLTVPVKLKGLDENAFYQLEEDGSCHGGDELMYAGVTCQPVRKDFVSSILIFKKIKNEKGGR